MNDDIAIRMRQWYISLLSENPELAADVLAASGEIERLRSWLEEIAKSDDEVSGPEAVCLALIAKDALAGKGLDDD